MSRFEVPEEVRTSLPNRTRDNGLLNGMRRIERALGLRAIRKILVVLAENEEIGFVDIAHALNVSTLTVRRLWRINGGPPLPRGGRAKQWSQQTSVCEKVARTKRLLAPEIPLDFRLDEDRPKNIAHRSGGGPMCFLPAGRSASVVWPAAR